MSNKPISTVYTIEIIDFPIDKKDRYSEYIYKSTLKIHLKLSYLLDKTSNNRIFRYIIPLKKIIPYESYSINTIKQMIESVTSELFSDNQILWTFDSYDNLEITIMNYSKIKINSVILNIIYKILVVDTNLTIKIPKESYEEVYFVNEKNSRAFSLPLYDEVETENITLNFILPKGWKMNYGKPSSDDDNALVISTHLSNKLTDKLDKAGLWAIPLKELLHEDKTNGNVPYIHYWNFKENNASVWSIIINKKEITNADDDIKSFAYNVSKIETFIFEISVGTKNILIVNLAKSLLFISCVFTVMFSIILFCDKEPDYINYLFADIGLATVIFAYFFSYAVQKNNGLRLHVSGDYIKYSITISLIMVGICMGLLLINMITYRLGYPIF